ncbi:MAG: hypothetical protein LWX56_12740 [Ignavibacteria bacterium]|nr:hypothetical protein [Ignavibacteria bacterium]
MSKRLLFLLMIGFVLIPEFMQAQETPITSRGSILNRRVGLHNGNLVHTVFTNYGVIAQPSTLNPRGAWKYDNNGYVGDVSPIIGLQLPIKHYPKDTNNAVLDTHHVSIITAVERPGGGKEVSGQFSGFEPIGGFFNPAYTGATYGVAMSHLLKSWPMVWPDKPDYTGFTEAHGDKDGYIPKVDWNGYFGRGREKSPTQESYYWMDDNDDITYFGKLGFTPDSTDPARRGQGIQVSVRGLQWGGDPVAQNVLFWLYNIQNDGTTTYDKAVFGLLVGTYVGIEGREYDDDASFFEIKESITYTWDYDNYIDPAANPRWLPDPHTVGYIAYAFLESPGNGYDGIDNDHDNSQFASTAPFFTPNDFVGRVFTKGDKVVLINKETFKRTLYTVPTTDGVIVDNSLTKPDTVITVKGDNVTVKSMGTIMNLVSGQTVLVEGDLKMGLNGSYVNPNAYDGIDNDLDGIIDENYTVHYRQFKKSAAGVTLIDTINATQYIDYLHGMTKAQMVDERRDDNIDNDLDWTLLDDVGKDGKANTHDPGEGDGIPTHGEPNFDEKDIHESDQLGLTSFKYFKGAGTVKMADDELTWSQMTPGLFETPDNIVNNIAIRGEDGDFLYGTGYFPLLSKATERFSLALAFGENLADVMRIKKVVQIIYNANYTFPLPPSTPTLSASTDGKSVTLYWDAEAEASIDHITHEKDFEGYKLYKSNSYDFSDVFTVTDARGNAVAYKEIQQWDLANSITGFYALSPMLASLYNGFSPFLGDDRGIVHKYVDTDVKPGLKYFYCLTAYDHGKNDGMTYPKENSIQGAISRDAYGTYTFEKNALAVIPAPPSNGYVAPTGNDNVTRVSGGSDHAPTFSIVDSKRVPSGVLKVTFKDKYIPVAYGTKDSVMQGPVAVSYSIQDTVTKNYLLTDGTYFDARDGQIFSGLAIKMDSSWKSPNYIQVDTIFWNLTNVKDTVGKFTPIASTQYSITWFTPNYPVYRAPKKYEFRFENQAKQSSYAIDTLNKLFIKGGFDSVAFVPKINFSIWDVTDVKSPKKIKFAFMQADPTDTTVTPDSRIFLSNAAGTDIEYMVTFSSNVKNLPVYSPKAGDTLRIGFTVPLTSQDAFIINTKQAYYDLFTAKSKMNDIKVVPNPYVVTNLYEPPLPSGLRGRGTRVIKFMNLPINAKVYIYTSSGTLIRTLETGSDLFNSTLDWDLRTREGLDVAFGVYFYVVEAQGFSDKKTGKIAIIK